MSDGFDRRRALQASLTIAAGSAAGLGVGSTIDAEPARAGGHDHDLPPVPGMSGDRWANEFWNEFDNATLFQQSPEVVEAFHQIQEYFATNDPPPRSLYVRWTEMRRAPEYPDNFIAFMTPIRAALDVLSRTQLGVIDRFYRHWDPRLVRAFGDFGQGVLYDPRHQPPVHTMGSQPPVGYHVWHVFLSGMLHLGIEPRRWRQIAPLNGFAWEVQSIAKPSQTEPNPGLPAGQVAALAAKWLRRSRDEIDTAFLSFPYPEGVS